MNVHLSEAAWFKSSYSGDKADCVEVAFGDSVVGVRDSKDQHGGQLVFPAREWDVFTAAVAAAKFD